jgi:hypothetical protein
MLLDCLSVCHHHCGAMDQLLPDNVPTRRQKGLYVLLRGSYIARRYYAARTMSMELALGHLQNPTRHILTSPDDVVMQKREVARFKLNPSLGSLHHHCHRAIWSQWAGICTPSGINPTLSRHFFRLVGEVGSGSKFPLGLLGRCPIPAATRL